MPRRLGAVAIGVGALTLSACSGPAGPAATTASSAPPTSSEASPSPTRTPTPTPAPVTPSATATTSPGATAAGTRSTGVTITAPAYDAPGASVPIVVTAANATRFDARLDGVAGPCEGKTWSHPGGVSQLCWVTLPTKAGRHTLTVRAHLSSGGEAVASRRLAAKGPVDAGLDRATRDRIRTCANPTSDVWLTFDDGFTSEARMREMLGVLEEKNVRGRFFALGSWARKNPEMVTALRRAGHLVENHTDTHAPLNTLGAESLAREIRRGPATNPTLLRPGYGAGAFTRRVVDAAKAQGQQVCYWTVDSQDWTGASSEVMVRRVVEGDHVTPPAQAGGNVLFHMTGKHTVQALPRVIDALRDEGLTLEPLR